MRSLAFSSGSFPLRYLSNCYWQDPVYIQRYHHFTLREHYRVDDISKMGVYSRCTVDFGEGQRHFIAEWGNYRRAGICRVDDLEILVDDPSHPAKILCFFQSSTPPAC